MIPMGLPMASARATPKKTMAPCGPRLTVSETPAAVKAKTGSTTYVDHGSVARSTRSAGETRRSATARKLRSPNRFLLQTSPSVSGTLELVF